MRYSFPLDRRLVFLAVAALGWLTGPCGASASNKKADIWFCPETPKELFGPDARRGMVDYMKLFDKDAPWQEAAAHIRVFKSGTLFIGRGSDADLRKFFAGLKERHMALAIEAGLLANPALSGKIEGYCGEFIGKTMVRIKALGGNVEYVAMDEPLDFGHLSNQPGALHTPIADMAKDVAHQAAVIHQYFPKAKIGDIEGIQASEGPADYVAQEAEFARAYKAEVGSPLAFLHMDVGEWKTPGWQKQLEEFSKMARSQGMAFGIIYNSDGNDGTGAEWNTHAERHFVEVESNPALVPDAAILQTWWPVPDHALPETDPGSMTYLVDRYAAEQTALKVAKTKAGFKGRLTTEKGLPVGDAEISTYETVPEITSTATIQGKVPAGTTRVVAGLRINAEGCHIDGPVNVTVEAGKYVEADSKNPVVCVLGPGKIILPPHKRTQATMAAFPVTAGQPFTFSVPVQVAESSRGCGYLALMFLGKDGREVERRKVFLEPGQQLIWTGQTDQRGRFTMPKPEGPAPTAFTFEFPGKKNLRLASLTLPAR
jgi:hypothetical protein